MFHETHLMVKVVSTAGEGLPTVAAVVRHLGLGICASKTSKII